MEIETFSKRENSRSLHGERFKIDDGTQVRSELAELISVDPAAWYIIHLILVGENVTISSLKEKVGANSELYKTIDPIITKLEDSDLVDIDGETIVPDQKLSHVAPKYLDRILPEFFEKSAARVLTDISLNKSKIKNESIWYAAVPDNEDSRRMAKEIYLKFKADIMTLFSNHAGGGSDDVRFIGFVNCILDSEDFE